MGKGKMDPFGSRNTMNSQYAQFQNNPMQFMASRGLNIPEQYANNPDGAIQYLMNTGKLSQKQFDFAQKFANMAFGRGR